MPQPTVMAQPLLDSLKAKRPDLRISALGGHSFASKSRRISFSVSSRWGIWVLGTAPEVAAALEGYGDHQNLIQKRDRPDIVVPMRIITGLIFTSHGKLIAKAFL